MNFNFTCESERYFCERSASPVSPHFESAAKWTNPILCMPGEFDRAIRIEQAEVYPCATSFIRICCAVRSRIGTKIEPVFHAVLLSVPLWCSCYGGVQSQSASHRQNGGYPPEGCPVFFWKGQRRFSLSLCWSGLRWPARLKCRTEQCTQPTISWLSKAGKVIKEKTEQLQGTFLDEMKAVYAPLIDVSTEVKVRRIQKGIFTGEEAENIERRKTWRRYF